MSQGMESSYFATIQKDKYSFGKSPRFPEVKQKCSIDYYDQPIKRNRSTSFGYGKKIDFFHQKQKNPSPSAYDIEDKNLFKKGISFGYGRNVTFQITQQIKHGSYMNPERFQGKDDQHYQPDPKISITKKKGPSCVIVNKHPTDSFIFLKEQDKNKPDPSKYAPNDSFFSRRKKSPDFTFGSSKRFNYQIDSFQRMIGPGTYNNEQKNRTKHGSFDHARKKTFVVEYIEKKNTPGPLYNIK